MAMIDAVTGNYDPAAEALVAAMSERLHLRNQMAAVSDHALNIIHTQGADARNRRGAWRAVMGVIAAVEVLDAVELGDAPSIWASIADANFIHLGVLASVWGADPPAWAPEGFTIGGTVH
jgi:hypothetical protein